MSETQILVVLVLALHWLADFVFQTRWMALNKSKQWGALIVHILEYGIVFCAGIPFGLTLRFILANAAFHFAVDAVTSRASNWCYENKEMRLFWIVVGFDQFLHGLFFLLTWSLLQWLA